ncbi:hypothetical protein LIP24_10395, partial [Collinsella aerofaciens]|uniref:hypothetical protein n=1 Tax=Collinsella aerofaciens TaxID=74426 RepID=UPI001D002D24
RRSLGVMCIDSSSLAFGEYIFIYGRPVSVAFFKRPVWEQTIGKQSNERPLQKNPAVPDASGKTSRKFNRFTTVTI